MTIDELLQTQSGCWRSGQRKLIEELVADPKSLSKDDLLNLVCNEARLKSETGLDPTLQEYQQRFPFLSAELETQWAIDALLDTREPVSDLDSTVAGNKSATSTSERSASLPTRIGRYEVMKMLGRGAAGVVYEAFDANLNRAVAIKCLRTDYHRDAIESQRFRLEAETVGRLRHPNIAQVYDSGREADVSYIVMEYCEQGTLAELIGEPLPVDQVLSIMLELTSAVAAAHAQGIIHRDLKPANVLLSVAANGETVCKVADFGLAKWVDAECSETMTGTVLGSPAYMAPEQAFGNAKQVGAVADVYSLGVIMYECLTGRPPFRGATVADTLDQVRHMEPVAVRSLQPSVPIDLETIAHKCLRKEPPQRYGSAGELAEDIRRFRDGEPIHARRESSLQTAFRIARRYPFASFLAATVTLLLLTVAIGSLIFAQRLNAARKRAESSEQASATAAREAKLGQADALLGRAHGIRLSRQPGQRFDALKAIRQAVRIGRDLGQPAEWFEVARTEAIAALLLPDIHVEQWRTEREPVQFADFSDDHQFYALSHQGTNEVELRRMKDHTVVATIPKTHESYPVRFAGHNLILTCEYHESTRDEFRNFQMWSIAKNSSDQVSIEKLWELKAVSSFFDFSRDRSLLGLANTHEFVVVDTQTGRTLASLAIGLFARDPVFAFHPVLPLVVFCSHIQPSVHLQNWQTGELLQDLRNEFESELVVGGTCTGAAWSPNGQQFLLISSGNDKPIMFDLAPEPIRLTRRSNVNLLDQDPLQSGGSAYAHFNSQGDRVLVHGWGMKLEILDPATQSLVMRSVDMKLVGPRLNWVMIPRVDPKGAYAGFCTDHENPKQFGLISIADAREARILVPFREGLGWEAAIDPSGRFLVDVVQEGLIFIDLETGSKLLELSIEDMSVSQFCFDRNGNLYLIGQPGCYRWPYTLSKSNPAKLVLGIPERIHVPYGPVWISCCDEGRTFTFGAWAGMGTQEYAGAWIKLRDEPAARKVRGGQAGASSATSPNGKFAVCTESVWSCQNRLTEVAKVKPGIPDFSRDGQWLMVGGQRFSTQDWSMNPTSSGSLNHGPSTSLSPDGAMFLTQRVSGSISLVDSSSNSELARLEWKETPCRSPAFTPDGTRVLFWSESGLVLLDLVQLRSKLTELGLDWEAPALHRSASPSPILSAEVARELDSVKSIDDLAELVDSRAFVNADQAPENADLQFSAGMAAIQKYQWDLALLYLDRTCELLPNAITARQWRAYLLAAMSDYQRAIEDADWVINKNLDEAPIEADFRLLRAEWLYCDRRYEAAIADCTRVIETKSNWTNPAYALRAACYAAMNQTELAENDDKSFLELTQFDVASLDMLADPSSGRDISLRRPIIALKAVRKIQSLNVVLTESVEHVVGRVLYRNKLYQEAAEWIERCLSRGKGEFDGHDLYVLAMSLQEMGQPDRARETQAHAQTWTPPLQLEFRNRGDLKFLSLECQAAVGADRPQ